MTSSGGTGDDPVLRKGGHSAAGSGGCGIRVPPTGPPPADDDAPAPRAGRTLGLLLTLMVIDFADRQVLVGAFPQLRREWGLSDTELGALVSILTLTVALAAMPVAAWVDRRSRVPAIALMGVVWSAAAAASGWAQGYGQLLAARVGVGAGEAGYGAAGAALLATTFPARHRATVLGALYAAGPLGAVIGTALGGAVAATWGWR